jgi:cytoskeletal protein RodZ
VTLAINKAVLQPLRAGGARPLDLGEFRRIRGLSLESIAETTKISTRFLRAIEDGEYSILPGGIFNTSYLRQYAAAVGYEEDVLLEHYGRSPGNPRRRMSRNSGAAADGSVG